jgi:phosphoenolpyruvate carboxykinase (GTP)
MAMLSFCGYNMGDYFAHWLATGSRIARAPKIFRVNWFRRGADGKFLWPGFTDNMRVLKWMVERIHGGARDVRETPVGFLPTPAALDTSGLNMRPSQLDDALRVDAGEWLDALSDLGEFYGQFGSRVPQPIAHKLAETRRGFGA